MQRTMLFIVFGLGFWIFASAQDVILTAPDQSTVTVHRDDYGVPHISGTTEAGVFFGQGYAVAEDRLFQMETFYRTAEGRLAEWYGSGFLPIDREARRLMYTRSERDSIFAALPADVQNMFTAYTAGVNVYLDSMALNPERFMPFECQQYPVDTPWTTDKSVQIAQFVMIIFGQNGGNELQRLVDWVSMGQEAFDETYPINDPTAPVTLHGDTQMLPPRSWHYSGMRVRESVVRELRQRDAAIRALQRQLGIPPHFGSFTALISPTKSATGNAMLLGCPQMGQPQLGEANTIHEVELSCPTLHVGGMNLAGTPGLIIGRNEHLTWTMTSGGTDNTDLYIDSTETTGYSRYWHNGGWVDLEQVTDTIRVLNRDPEIYTRYRTVHGPVTGADLLSHQIYSVKWTFRALELNMAVAAYYMSKAATMGEFAAAIRWNPMSFNVLCAADDGQIGYWHVGRYQDRTDGVDPRLPHRGDGSEEWQGFIPFENLPYGNAANQDYFVNWNNKPVQWWDQGDNVPWVGWNHVVNIDNFVAPIAEFTFDHLKHIPQQINDHGSYQEALELSPSGWRDENIVPPGQSAFIDIHGTPSPHTSDQWSLHQGWQFKDQLFGDVVTAPPAPPSLPASIRFAPAYPNPFNPVTKLSFTLPAEQSVQLKIYDVQGRVVEVLTDRRYSAGEYSFPFDATGLPSGLYFARLIAGEFSQSQKILLLK